MTAITFVRHGNTDWNVEKRAQGHSLNPLNETGRRQAAAVAGRLAEQSWDVLISSDLPRAQETAEIIAARIGMPIARLDPRIREIGRGQIEGTVEAERIAKWGSGWRQLELGLESEQALRERGLQFVAEVAADYAGRRILVVSHGVLLRETLLALLPNRRDEEPLHNTSVTTIVRNGEGWDCPLYNCTAHL